MPIIEINSNGQEGQTIQITQEKPSVQTITITSTEEPLPTVLVNNNVEVRHTDEINDIIAAVPSWILRWGVMLFFCILMVIISLSAFIKYPDIVKSQLKIESPNAPKPVVAKVSGKLIKLLVKENTSVVNGQILAYMESTGNHDKIRELDVRLKELQGKVIEDKPINRMLFLESGQSSLGELQSAYQTFYQQYLNYKSAISDGFYLKKKAFLKNDLTDQTKQIQQLNEQKKIQQRGFTIADDDYQMHQKLAKEKVETPAELRQQEGKYLAQKAPLVQTESAIITANNNYSAKRKEILELDNQIREEKAKFLQALNSLISQADDWKSKYILTAPEAGKLSYAGVIQENQVQTLNQEVFYINPGTDAFFGEMAIPQTNMGKVSEGQVVLIKLKSFPFEEFGMIRGRISSIADVPYKDSVFLSRVNFKVMPAKGKRKSIHLKQGMIADAEIVTQDATVLQRIYRSVFKMLQNGN